MKAYNAMHLLPQITGTKTLFTPFEREFHIISALSANWTVKSVTVPTLTTQCCLIIDFPLLFFIYGPTPPPSPYRLVLRNATTGWFDWILVVTFIGIRFTSILIYFRMNWNIKCERTEGRGLLYSSRVHEDHEKWMLHTRIEPDLNDASKSLWRGFFSRPWRLKVRFILWFSFFKPLNVSRPNYIWMPN